MDPSTPAPAAPASPPPMADFVKFQDAHTSRTPSATPAPTVEKTAPVPSAEDTPTLESLAAEPRKLSNRQIEANERTQRAVEAATADLQAEIRRLRGSTPPEAPAAPTPPPAAKFPPLKEWIAQAGNEEKSLEDYLDARDDFRDTAKRETVSRQSFEQRTQTHLAERDTVYRDVVTKAYAADPELFAKLPPGIGTARPLSGLQPGEKPTFANVAAEAAFWAEGPIELLKHLHTHPEDVQRIRALPTIPLMLSALARLDGRLAGPAAGSPPSESTSPATVVPAPDATISKAPPPAPTITKIGVSADPEASALKRQDFAAFQEIHRQKRIASRSGGAS